MNPSQRSIHIDSINRLLDGSAAVKDVTLPKTAQKTRGQPKGALNKPRTTNRDPSGFEILEKKRKAEDQQEEKKKKLKKTEDTKQTKTSNLKKTDEPPKKSNLKKTDKPAPKITPPTRCTRSSQKASEKNDTPLQNTSKKPVAIPNKKLTIEIKPPRAVKIAS
jgi:hypothetical protein